MKKMKQIGKKHKWLVCLLAIVMLVGVITPLGIALAENVTKTGTLALTSAYANGTSPYSYACLEFKSTTTMNLQTGKLTADGGAVLYNGASLGTYAIRVDNVNGTFVIDGIAAPKATCRCRNSRAL